MTNEQLNNFGAQIQDACISVHRELGPGLLESVYIFALLKEFELRNIRAKANIGISLFYKGHDTGKFFEIDILVENEIIIEAKAADIMHPVFDAQIITYLKLANKKLGYLVNFNVPLMKDGFRRFVNNF